VAVAVTLIVHGGILLPWLLMQGPPAPPPTPPVELALLHPERPPPPEHKAAATGKVASAPAAAAPTPPVEAQASAPPQPAAMTQPSAAATASSPPGAQAAVPGPAGASGVSGLNLTCLGSQKRLTAEERRKCDDKQWAGVGRHDPSNDGRVPPPLIDPNKAAFYEAVLAARHSPGHGPGFGCGMEIATGEGGSKMSKLLKKKRLAKEAPHEPPHSLKFGPLPCYLTPPQGFLTPEADVPPQDTFTNGHAPSQPTFIEPIFRDQQIGPGR
jgi:hypothetical protein